MAIEYTKVGWNESPYKYANPTNMDKMDTGIKAAVDGVNALENVPSDLARNGYGEQSGSRNLADWQKASHNIYTYSDGTASNSSYYQGILQKYYVHGETVRLNYKTNSQLTASAWCAITLYDVSGNYTRNVGASAKTLSVTPNDNEYYASFVLYGQSGVPASAYEEVMFTTDSDTTYEPYYESNKILTEDVNEVQSLKYLGWTVPKQLAVKNVAKVGGGLHQRVGRVDLGTLSFAGNGSGTFWGLLPSAKNKGACYVNGYTSTTKAYTDLADKEVSLNVDGLSASQYVIIKNTSYTDATQFRNAVSGTYLYYELGTSVEITTENDFFEDENATYGLYAKAIKVGNLVTCTIYKYGGSEIANNDTVALLNKIPKPIVGSPVMGISTNDNVNYHPTNFIVQPVGYLTVNQQTENVPTISFPAITFVWRCY